MAINLPHIRNSRAGVDKEEPVFGNCFECYFELPKMVTNKMALSANDLLVLTQQVTKVTLEKETDLGPKAVDQSYKFAHRKYAAPMVEETAAKIEIELNLNLRKAVDNYVWKIFREWNNLVYNSLTGEMFLKEDYAADSLKIIEHNRRGDIFRERIFKNVWPEDGIKGFGKELEYNGDGAPVIITLSFWADYWDEIVADKL